MDRVDGRRRKMSMAAFVSSLNFSIRIVFHVLCTLTFMTSKHINITTTNNIWDLTLFSLKLKVTFVNV